MASAADIVRHFFNGIRSLPAVELIAWLLVPLALISPQAIALTLGIAAVAACVFRPAEALAAVKDSAGLARQPALLAAAAFLSWVAVSCLWSPAPLLALSYFARIAVSLVLFVGLLALVSGESGNPRRLSHVVAIGAAVGAVLLLVAARRTDWINSWTGLSLVWFHFNRAGIVLALMLPFVLAHSTLRLPLKAVLAVLIVAAVMNTESETAKFSVVTIVMAYALTAYLPRVAVALCAALCVTIVLVVPVLAGAAADVVPASAAKLFDVAHVAQRVEILKQYAVLIPQRPLAGWGMEGSRIVFDNAEALVPPAWRLMAKPPIHPHNQPLQIWFEFGLLGVILFNIALVMLFRRIGRMPAPVRPLALAVTVGLFAIGLVSHGMWQSWWVVLVGALTLLVAACAQAARADETAGGSAG